MTGPSSGTLTKDDSDSDRFIADLLLLSAASSALVFLGFCAIVERCREEKCEDVDGVREECRVARRNNDEVNEHVLESLHLYVQ